MRILIDLQGAQNNSSTRGIGRFARAFATALLRHPGNHDIYLLVNELFHEEIDALCQSFSPLLPPERIIRFAGAGPTAEVDGVIKPDNYWRLGASELLYEKFLSDLDMDAVILCSLFEGAQDDSILSLLNLYRRHVTAIVLHDLIPLKDPNTYIRWAPSRRWYDRKVESLRRADILLSVSHSAKQEAIELAKIADERIAVIGSAAAEHFIDPRNSPVERQNLLDRYNISRPFVMHMSAYEARKNFEGLIMAFGALPVALLQRHQLVLVCKLDEQDRLRLEAAIEEAGLTQQDVILAGYVPDDVLPALYAACRLFVFPSFHEGFGLPVLEAMQCGTPVVGSNVSSIPEVIGWDEALFDPASKADMARLLERALGDDAFYSRLRAHAVTQATRFTWDGVACRAIAAIEHARAIRPENVPLADVLRAQESERLLPMIASVYAETPPSRADLRSVAVALARNEASARLIRQQARAGEAVSWRIEGPFDSCYSLALVNRETARALASLGHAPQLYSTEGGGDFAPDPAFLATHPDLSRMHEAAHAEVAEPVLIASRNLFPPRVDDFAGSGLRALHGYAWEETGFPAEWVADFNAHLDLILVTSRHVEKLLIDNGVRTPITITGNGVDHWERIQPNPAYRITARSFRFLHVSSCFPRKGITNLLDAYGDAFSRGDDVSLIIKSFHNPHNSVASEIAARQAANPNYPDIVLILDDLPEADLKSLYGQCDALVAPSCAEGYGLPLAEAMLSGLPVITTGWSGQLDFCNEGNSWLVDYRFERALSHFGLYASAWARVDRAALARTLRIARDTPRETRAKMASAGRAELLAEHQWRDVAAKMLDAHGELPLRRASLRAPHIGWISTWNARCGIATYSEHLVRHLGIPVTILAAHEKATTRTDDAQCVRCWTASKDSNGLADVLEEAIRRGIGILVIQFNYAFYNHDELCTFIDDAKAAGCVIVIMMHSTTDPVKEIPGAELFRMIDHLRACDRLLVHSISDLNRLKTIGLVDNVALFPHGAIASEPTASRSNGSADTVIPLIATYGFCLPNKGLSQLVEAIAILRDARTPVRLRMLNAAFPGSASTALIDSLRAQITAYKLEGLVEFDSAFRTDEESLDRLAEADLIVFAYQHSGESASGAVRYGMSVGRPVAVTPQPIFSDVDGAVFTLPGASPSDIAKGIAAAMESIRTGSEEARAVATAAKAWRREHDFAQLGPRLANMCRAIFNRKASPPTHFLASSQMLAARDSTVIGPARQIAAGSQGTLVSEMPSLSAGSYAVTLTTSRPISDKDNICIQISRSKTNLLIARGEALGGKKEHAVRFAIDQQMSVTISVEGDQRMDIETLSVIPLPSTGAKVQF